jgi:hypothetical protein
MGLDVTAFRNARIVEAYGYSAYNANGIDRLDGIPEGQYLGDDEINFRAGSYGGYNEWRRWLSTTFLGVAPEVVWHNADDYAGKPFFELINFGDNEGAFGPKTSLKLANDFREHRPPTGTDQFDIKK